ncbi:MAG: DegT/DnrJ/EryC1/StrS family aminotransferase [Candidatus Hodarchaeota archaeon]
MTIPPAKIHFPKGDIREILTKIEVCLSSGQLTLGENGKRFEDEFAKSLSINHAVAVNSGTSAIEIPLRILGVTNKEVLVPTNTFFATPAAVVHAGGKVRFVDADPNTFSISLEDLRTKLTDLTVGVIIVHIAGIVTPGIYKIREFCKENELFLFEDAAHAQGSKFNGQMAGTFGDAASFSFYPTKVMTSAEGGMIVTNDNNIKNAAMLYRDQGKISFTQNYHDKLGYNWRMSEPHAIIGLSQFHRIREFIEARRAVAAIYDEGLRSIPKIKSLELHPGCESNYYKYIALLEDGFDRAKLKKILREKFDVYLSGEVYETPCHLQPIFREATKEGEFPKAEDICGRHVCLPIYATMTKNEAYYVLESLENAIRQM